MKNPNNAAYAASCYDRITIVATKTVLPVRPWYSAELGENDENKTMACVRREGWHLPDNRCGWYYCAVMNYYYASRRVFLTYRASETWQLGVRVCGFTTWRLGNTFFFVLSPPTASTNQQATFVRRSSIVGFATASDSTGARCSDYSNSCNTTKTTICRKRQRGGETTTQTPNGSR